MIKEKIKRRYRVGKYIIYKETLVGHKETFWSFISSFIGVALIGISNYYRLLFVDIKENTFRR